MFNIRYRSHWRIPIGTVAHDPCVGDPLRHAPADAHHAQRLAHAHDGGDARRQRDEPSAYSDVREQEPDTTAPSPEDSLLADVDGHLEQADAQTITESLQRGEDLDHDDHCPW